MKKIESLTPEQTDRLADYREKWIQIGLNTDPCNRPLAEKSIRAAYKNAALSPPRQIVWVNSPMGVLIAYAVLQGIGPQVRTQVWTQIGPQVRTQVRDQIGPQVLDQVGALVLDQVRALVGDKVWNQVRDKVGSQIKNFGYGAHDASWLGFYQFFDEVLGLEGCAALRPLATLAEHCGWWLPYENVAICSEKPAEIHLSDTKRLHRDGGPAIRFRDDWSVWALNGIRVSKQIAETPADRIPIRWWAEEENVEIRHELEKKIGTERILAECEGTCIHQDIVTVGGRDHAYAVLELTLANDDRRRLLDMTNPSTGETHKEWLPPEIATVQEAITWRNGASELPTILT